MAFLLIIFLFFETIGFVGVVFITRSASAKAPLRLAIVFVYLFFFSKLSRFFDNLKIFKILKTF